MTSLVITSHHKACLLSRACSQVQKLIDEDHLDIEKKHSISEEKEAQWNDEAAQADNNEEELKEDNDEKSAFLHPIKKRCWSVAEKKLSLKRCVKCCFLSPLSSDDEIETGPESDTSSYAPAKLCCTSNRRLFFSSLLTGCERKLNPVDALESVNERLKWCSLFQTAVVNKQQCSKEKIVHQRDVRQGCRRPQKQYHNVFTSDTNMCSTQSYDSHSSLSASQFTSESNDRSRTQAATVSDQREWEISKVLNERWIKERKGKTGVQFLIQWKITWVDEYNIHTSDLIKQFKARLVCSDCRDLMI